MNVEIKDNDNVLKILTNKARVFPFNRVLTIQWRQSHVGKDEKDFMRHLHHFFAVFPGCLGDTQFCFRFRQGSNRKSSLGCFLETTDRDAPPCLKVCRHIRNFGPITGNALCMSAVWLTRTLVRSFQREQGHYYGYVYFRQVRDKSLKRGYFQKVSD